MSSRLYVLPFLLASALFFSGCAEKKHASTRLPLPPSADTVPANPAPPAASVPQAIHPSIESDVYSHHKPLYTEIGLASWYGPPYHNRRAASGEVFDMYQITAAHKTLPLNSICRVTNLATGQRIIVRINDRGPFVGDRILDLSLAAAKQVGVWRP